MRRCPVTGQPPSSQRSKRESLTRLTVDKQLLLLRQDAGQVGALQPTLPLRGVPGATVCEVLVAVGLKLLPAEAANLRVCKDTTSSVVMFQFSLVYMH